MKPSFKHCWHERNILHLLCHRNLRHLNLRHLNLRLATDHPSELGLDLWHGCSFSTVCPTCGFEHTVTVCQAEATEQIPKLTPLFSDVRSKLDMLEQKMATMSTISEKVAELEVKLVALQKSFATNLPLLQLRMPRKRRLQSWSLNLFA